MLEASTQLSNYPVFWRIYTDFGGSPPVFTGENYRDEYRPDMVPWEALNMFVHTAL